MKLRIVFIKGIDKHDHFYYCDACAYRVIKTLQEYSPKENRCACGREGYYTLSEKEGTYENN